MCFLFPALPCYQAPPPAVPPSLSLTHAEVEDVANVPVSHRRRRVPPGKLPAASAPAPVDDAARARARACAVAWAAVRSAHTQDPAAAASAAHLSSGGGTGPGAGAVARTEALFVVYGGACSQVPPI